jgi:hypothetical protein
MWPGAGTGRRKTAEQEKVGKTQTPPLRTKFDLLSVHKLRGSWSNMKLEQVTPKTGTTTTTSTTVLPL